nr:serine/arginine-rich SC35-like splicing factor SCL30 [Ipomoea batatas]
MRRYSPAYYSPPRRGYGGRPRSPPRWGYGGGGRHREQNHGSLLVRNIPLDCRGFVGLKLNKPKPHIC